MTRAVTSLLLLSAPTDAPGAKPHSPPDVTVASYNLRNYARPAPGACGVPEPVAAKPEREIAVIVRTLRAMAPDILCVQEIGPADSLDDLRTRLRTVGLDYPHWEQVEGPDEERRIALLARAPIIERHSLSHIRFDLGGAIERVRRGILDVVIEITPVYRLRVIVLHLKSRRAAPGGEALVRRHEAQIVRRHMDRILLAQPTVNLLVMGDLNDTKDQPVIQEIVGVAGSRTHMADLPLADESGDRWTLYWDRADSYDRIDYALVSHALLPEIVRARCRIHREPDWHIASDHRPIVVGLRAADRPPLRRPDPDTRAGADNAGPRVSGEN